MIKVKGVDRWIYIKDKKYLFANDFVSGGTCEGWPNGHA